MDFKLLTTDDVIKMASEIDREKSKSIEVYIKRMDGTIKLRKPSNDVVIDSLEITRNEGGHEGDISLLYECIISPDVKSSKLQDAYNVSRPVEIIDKIFTLGEITEIASILAKESGVYAENGVRLVDDIKN